MRALSVHGNLQEAGVSLQGARERVVEGRGRRGGAGGG